MNDDASNSPSPHNTHPAPEGGAPRRRTSRTAVIIAGGVVVALAATGTVIALRHNAHTDAGDQKSAHPTSSAHSPEADASTSTPATSATTPATQITPQTSCLTQLPPDWKAYFPVQGRFSSPDYHHPILLSSGPLIIARNVRTSPGAPISGVSLRRFADPQLPESTEIFRLDKPIADLVSDEARLVWSDADASGNGVGLSAKPLSGGATVRLTEDRLIGHPRFTAPGQVSWVAQSQGVSVIRQFDFAANKVKDLLTVPGSPSSVALFGGHFAATVGEDQVLYTLMGAKTATFARTTSIQPTTPNEMEWALLQDGKLTSWGKEFPYQLVLPERPAKLTRAMDHHVTWETADGRSFLTDTMGGGTVAVASATHPSPGLPRIELEAHQLFPGLRGPSGYQNLTCS